MTGLSQSAFLQALGSATLNSIWQMGLLWCCFLGANYVFKLSATKKYFFSVTALLVGTAWFIATLLLYYNGFISTGIGLSNSGAYSFDGFLPTILSAASATYLLLLFIPAYRLVENWKKVQSIRKYGLQKVDVHYKLFVKKLTEQLRIKKHVGVFISNRVKSPLTIGYLKPLILLPLASITNLTPQQVEAVLLHELSHIKRFDYLVNILVSIIHTVLYFNPFAKLLIRVVQEEREHCCDQMVLQFGYDKVSYASALLSLEKTSVRQQTLVLGASGKRNLLNRIEKIIGVEKKIVFQFNHLIGMAAALFCIVFFNSVLVLSKETGVLEPVSFNNLANPFYFFEEVEHARPATAYNKNEERTKVPKTGAKAILKVENQKLIFPDQYFVSDPESVLQLTPVAFSESLKLSEDKKEHIKTTLENTRKVLTTYEWKEVEKTIGDGLTPAEKAAVRQEYLKEVKEIDWENMERNLQAAYETIDWEEVDGNLKTALTSIRLDSLQKTCEQTLRVLEKVQAEAKSLSNLSFLPFPDESIDSIKQREQEVQTRLDKIKALTDKKVIKL